MVHIIAHLNELAKDSSNEDVIAGCGKALDTFIDENGTTFNFSDVKDVDYDKLMSDFSVAISSGHALSVKLLTVMRLLSRDKKLVINMKDINLSMKLFSDLYDKECTVSSVEYTCKVEILKCLCNWVFHSKAIRDYIIANNIINTMIEQVRTSQLGDHVFYQIRLLFLISAMEASERAKMLENGALTSLLCVIDEGLKQIAKSLMKADVERSLSEVLKALFNITFELSNVSSEHVQNDYKRLASLSRTMLCTFCPFDHQGPNEIFTHIVNVFLNYPKDAIALLVPPVGMCSDVNPQFLKSKHPIIYQDHDMSAIVIMLDALEQRIVFEDYTLMKEKTLTILSVFSYICRINGTIRKYLKNEILPRLKTSSVRPEEQSGLRGRIIRLMQTVDIPLKNMAADFLFVLCKENTTRLIKYTGYGNSAGFLASRGMMVPGIPYAVDGEYSTDEDSGEEDEDIDLITGATALPKEDIFANLTEQEKEQEIDNLISLTNRLKELNVVKPMAVKSDGTLVPVDELEPVERRDSDSD